MNNIYYILLGKTRMVGFFLNLLCYHKKCKWAKLYLVGYKESILVQISAKKGYTTNHVTISTCMFCLKACYDMCKSHYVSVICNVQHIMSHLISGMLVRKLSNIVSNDMNPSIISCMAIISSSIYQLQLLKYNTNGSI